MLRKVLATLSAVATLISWFFRETFKAWFFEQVAHHVSPLVSPFAAYLFEYGIPAAFAALCIWLLWRKPRARETFGPPPNPTSLHSPATAGTDDYVLLTDIAAEIYPQVQNSAAAGWAIGCSRGNLSTPVPETIARSIAEETTVPIFGRQPFVPHYEEIHKRVFSREDISWSANAIRRAGDAQAMYEDLSMRRDDVEKVIWDLNNEGLESIVSVARELYTQLRAKRLADLIENACDRNGRLDQTCVLNICQAQIARTSIPIFGKHPPSEQLEEITKDKLSEGGFKNGSFYRQGQEQALFTDVSIRATDRPKALDEVVASTARMVG